MVKGQKNGYKWKVKTQQEKSKVTFYKSNISILTAHTSRHP